MVDSWSDSDVNDRSEDEDDIVPGTPPEIREQAELTALDLLPQKSKERKFPTLLVYLKRKSSGYQPKKSKTLSAKEIEKFLVEAPNNQFLLTKVALIFGVCGGCRRGELVNITTHQVQHHGELIKVNIPDTKNKVPRSFTIEGTFCEIIKLYESLRDKETPSDRFFVNYLMGKRTKQVVGINKFGGMPKQIAEFPNLPEPALYTGHCLRRTSATLLVDAGGDILHLMRHGGWRSETVARGYIENSLQNKRKIGNLIMSDINISMNKENQNAGLSREPMFGQRITETPKYVQNKNLDLSALPTPFKQNNQNASTTIVHRGFLQRKSDVERPCSSHSDTQEGLFNSMSPQYSAVEDADNKARANTENQNSCKKSRIDAAAEYNIDNKTVSEENKDKAVYNFYNCTVYFNKK